MPLRRINGTMEASRLVLNMANCFGNPLTSMDKIDDFSKDEKIIYIKNSFWYAIVTFSLNEIINEYDEWMGIGAFRSFCELLEEYEKTKNKEIYRDLMQQIHEFYLKKEEISVSA